MLREFVQELRFNQQVLDELGLYGVLLVNLAQIVLLEVFLKDGFVCQDLLDGVAWLPEAAVLVFNLILLD